MKKEAVTKETIGPVQREINRRKGAIKRMEAKISQLRTAFDEKRAELETTIGSHRAVLRALQK